MMWNLREDSGGAPRFRVDRVESRVEMTPLNTPIPLEHQRLWNIANTSISINAAWQMFIKYKGKRGGTLNLYLTAQTL